MLAKNDGFTLVEVFVVVGVLWILTVGFLGCLHFTLKSLTTSVNHLDLISKGQHALEEVVVELKSYKGKEITGEIIEEICSKHSDPLGDFTVSIRVGLQDRMYTGEIIFKESRYNKLWTRIYIPEGALQ